MATYYEYNGVTGFLIGTYEVPPNIVRPFSTLIDYAPIPPPRAKWNGVAWVNDGAQEAQWAADAALYAAQAWGGLSAPGPLRVVTAAATINVNDTIIITAAASATYVLPVAPALGSMVLVGAAAFATVGAAQATLDAGVGVKIAGRTRFLVLTHSTAVLLRWNGVQWQSFTLFLDSPWVDGGVIGITATTANPTKGVTSRDKFWWKRVDQDLLVRYEYRQTAVGTNGTGHYLFALPFAVDTTVAIVNATVSNNDPYVSSVGDARYIRGTESVVGSASLFDATHFRISGFHLGNPVNSSDNAPVNSALGLNNASVLFSASIRVPIVNW